MHFFPHPAVGWDKAGDADKPCVRKEPRHLSDASNVLFAVLGAETQVFVQPLTDIVPVQSVAGDTVAHEVLLQGHAHCGLSCTG